VTLGKHHPDHFGGVELFTNGREQQLFPFLVEVFLLFALERNDPRAAVRVVLDKKETSHNGSLAFLNNMTLWSVGMSEGRFK
jgi:hypothetical protein